MRIYQDDINLKVMNKCERMMMFVWNMNAPDSNTIQIS